MKYSDVMLIVLWKEKTCFVSDEVLSKYETSNTVVFYFILSFWLANLPLLKKQNIIRHLEWIKYQAINKAKAKIAVLNKNFSLWILFIFRIPKNLCELTYSTHIHWVLFFLFGRCIFSPFVGVKFIELRIFPLWIWSRKNRAEKYNQFCKNNKDRDTLSWRN